MPEGHTGETFSVVHKCSEIQRMGFNGNDKQVLLIVINQSASLTSAVGIASPVANTNLIITSD